MGDSSPRQMFGIGDFEILGGSDVEYDDELFEKVEYGASIDSLADSSTEPKKGSQMSQESQVSQVSQVSPRSLGLLCNVRKMFAECMQTRFRRLVFILFLLLAGWTAYTYMCVARRL